MLKFFTDEDFRNDLKIHNSIYVFFHSSGCIPCLEVYPKVEKFGKTTNNLLYIVPEDEGLELQKQLNVTAFPSIVLIEDRKIKKAGLGAKEVKNIIGNEK
jgi:thiol-disulfide isomerase/thioredoxin